MFSQLAKCCVRSMASLTLPFIFILRVRLDPDGSAALIKVHENPTEFVWRQLSLQTITSKKPRRLNLDYIPLIRLPSAF